MDFIWMTMCVYLAIVSVFVCKSFRWSQITTNRWKMAKSKKIKQNKNTSPKPQNHRKCFIFEMTIPHIGDEQRVPKRGNVCIESGQLNNKKWDKLKALINAKRTHIKRKKTSMSNREIEIESAKESKHHRVI